MALLEKNALCPWEAAAKSAAQSTQKTAAANGDAAAANSDAAAADGDAAPAPIQPVKVFEPSQKKRKFFGFREDPFVYIQVFKLSSGVSVKNIFCKDPVLIHSLLFFLYIYQYIIE